MSPDQLPIEVFEYGGKLVSANSRSVAALSEAGLMPTNVTRIKPNQELLNRLLEPSLLSGSPLPASRVPMTPSKTDLTILRVIEVPNPNQ